MMVRQIVIDRKILLTCICGANNEIELMCVFLGEVLLTRIDKVGCSELTIRYTVYNEYFQSILFLLWRVTDDRNIGSHRFPKHNSEVTKAWT